MLLLAAWVLAAQTPQSAALVRGVLLERDPQPHRGSSACASPTIRCSATSSIGRRTSSARNSSSTSRRIHPGEKVEVVSDSLPGSVLRYARTVHVMDNAPPRARRRASDRFRSANRLAEERVPPGTLTYAGVVFRISGERLVLHTRDGGEQSLLLRKDTRYLRNGEIVDPATLKLNTRVFVRAGKDLWDQVEAYQVIWGKILEP